MQAERIQWHVPRFPKASYLASLYLVQRPEGPRAPGSSDEPKLAYAATKSTARLRLGADKYSQACPCCTKAL